MKFTTNKQGRNSFNLKNKSPFPKSRNGNQRQNKLNQNKLNKFVDNFDEEVVKNMIKNINNIKDDKAQSTSESDDEVDDQINVNKRQEGEESSSESNSNESEDENESDAHNSEEEAGGNNNSMETSSEESEEEAGGNNNSMETSSEESEEEAGGNNISMETSSKESEGEDVTKQNLNATSPLSLHVTDPEEKKKRNARTIDISNLPSSIKQMHLEKILSRYGKIEDIKVNTSKLSKNKGTATVLFKTVEAADKSIEIQGLNYKGKYLLVNKRVAATRDEDNSHSIYVTWNQGVDVGFFINTMESLYGTITNVIVDRKKRFAFVHFASPDSVTLAVAAGTITIGSFVLGIHAAGKKDSGKLPQSEEERRIKGKVQSKQHQQNLHTVLQTYKNNFIKPQASNGTGNQGPNRDQKQQHNVKSGFVQKRRY